MPLGPSLGRQRHDVLSLKKPVDATRTQEENDIFSHYVEAFCGFFVGIPLVFMTKTSKATNPCR